MKYFVIFIIFSIIAFNGCRQRNQATQENTDVPFLDLPEAGINEVINQAFLREIDITSPRMNGPDIILLQERLLELGFAELGEADGYYGPKTAGEIYFIKSALGFTDYIVFSQDEEHYAGTDLDFRPADYQLVNKELWDIIFNPEYTAMLSDIGLIRLFNNDPLVWEPEENPKVSELTETALPYIEPDWVPSWGLGVGSKVQKEYFYDAGTKKISVTETIESGWEYVTTIRDFAFQNGQRIRQSIFLESSPYITVKFSLHDS